MHYIRDDDLGAKRENSSGDIVHHHHKLQYVCGYCIFDFNSSFSLSRTRMQAVTVVCLFHRFTLYFDQNVLFDQLSRALFVVFVDADRSNKKVLALFAVLFL